MEGSGVGLDLAVLSAKDLDLVRPFNFERD